MAVPVITRRTFLGRLAAMGIAVKTIDGDALTAAFQEAPVPASFVPGSFVYLDQGTLDLGLVRDSVLNARNDYQLFAEVFEGVDGWQPCAHTVGQLSTSV